MNTNSKTLIKSVAQLLTGRIFQRVIGLISTLILVRILSDTQFGTIIFCTIVVQLFNILAVSGADQYIIRHEDPKKEDIDSAWTLDIILKGSLYIVLFITAPLINNLLPEMEVTLAIRILGLILIFECTQNPGLFLLKKSHNFGKIVTTQVLARTFTTAILVVTAIKIESYWAFIIADMAYWLVFLTSTYAISDYRPNLCTKKIRHQLSFSKWMLLKGMIGYARAQLDSFIISKSIGAAALGAYGTTKNNLLLIATEVVKPISEPLLASLSNIKKKDKEWELKVSTALLLVSFITAPIATSCFVFSDQLSYLLLGEGWDTGPGIMKAISPILFLAALPYVTNAVLVSLNKVKLIFIWEIFSLTFLVATLLSSLLFINNVVHIAMVRTFIEIAITPALIITAYSQLKTNSWRASIVLIPLSVSLTIFILTKFFIERYFSNNSINYSYSELELANHGFFRVATDTLPIILISLLGYLTSIISLTKILNNKMSEFEYLSNTIKRLVPKRI